MEMKIGIMTFWWSKDNYGQLLQCYALQKYLQDMGHDAYLIRYLTDYDNIMKKTPFAPVPYIKKMLKALNPIKLYNYLCYKIKSMAVVRENRINDKRKFEDFRKKYIKQSEKIYYSYDELKRNPPQADVYIVGSDQIWNPDAFLSKEKPMRAYFLDFGSPLTKRISYAPSFCQEKLSDEIINMITPLLQKFSYVSVREKPGINICKSCGIDNVEWVPDPTMLLNADAYRALYRNEVLEKTNKRYCFFYYLNNCCDFSFKTIYDWAKKKNLEIVYVSANLKIDKYKKTYATIPEWIYLLEHAEYVITNSYHCAVFSLLFEKKFGIISLSGELVRLNDRLNSLFEQFQLEKRFLDSNFSVLDKEINWQFISEKFQILRDSCRLADFI
ncbi:MAG: polysaccharide pyruvyl transferase family protein [Chitinispirillales bacterium]|jgi:hypothetical protein|nr:polysaccharide pyruvyl transferase family protein [Chitinispirillales bacterium]